MKRLVHWLEAIQGFFGVVLFTSLTAVVFLQVLTRYVFHSPVLWSEEMARFLFFWTALTGASISVKNQRHFVIEVFSVDKIKNPLGKRLIMVLPHLLILSFALIMAVYGYQYALSGRFRIGPTSRLPMFYVFMATPVAGVTMVIYTVYNLLRLLVDEADKVTDNASRNSQTG